MVQVGEGKIIIVRAPPGYGNEQFTRCSRESSRQHLEASAHHPKVQVPIDASSPAIMLLGNTPGLVGFLEIGLKSRVTEGVYQIRQIVPGQPCSATVARDILAGKLSFGTTERQLWLQRCICFAWVLAGQHLLESTLAPFARLQDHTLTAESHSLTL